jgi:hypothetical protein
VQTLHLDFEDRRRVRVRGWFGICAQFSVLLAHLVSYHAQKTVTSLRSEEVRITSIRLFTLVPSVGLLARLTRVAPKTGCTGPYLNR